MKFTRGSSSRTPQRLDVDSNPVSVWDIGPTQINDVSFSPNGQFVALALEDGQLFVLNWFTDELQFALKSRFGAFTCVDISHDSKYIASGSKDDLVCVWSIDDVTLCAVGRKHKSWLSSVCFAHNSYLIASCGEDARMCAWNFAPPLKSIPHDFADAPPLTLLGRCDNEKPLCDVEFFYDSLVSIAWDGCVRIWRIAESKANALDEQLLLGTTPYVAVKPQPEPKLKRAPSTSSSLLRVYSPLSPK
jgi:WD40 repeat protein